MTYAQVFAPICSLEESMLVGESQRESSNLGSQSIECDGHRL